MSFFKLSALLLSLCAGPPVQAQSNTSVGIEAIIAHFHQSELVPALLPPFVPTALLAASYKGFGAISPGQPLTRDQVLNEPSLSVTPANSSVMLKGKYTMLMADAGPPGTVESHGQRRHWLVNGVTISGTNVSMVGAMAVTQYLPPNPPVGSGPHRYPILLFVQPADFIAPPSLSNPNMGGGIFVVEEYVRSSKLGPLVAATYFTCQEGIATFTVPPTSAVASETLSGWNNKVGTKTAGAAAEKTNSGLVATGNSLALFLAPILGFLAL
ncbi:PEBP-like protein [Paxillus ammoniavirescens]|nr:PEBP-like protein [Paxillus ammoniavirescens]